MAKGKEKSVFFCQECGYESAKWLGKCPGCGQWNTFVEELVTKQSADTGRLLPSSEPMTLQEIQYDDVMRIDTGIYELNRVLGGGMVPGALMLLAGDPGIGKSTLTMQLAGTIHTQDKILYVSGEESRQQLKMRAQRLGVNTEQLYILTENNLAVIEKHIDKIKPRLLILDSIQTVYLPEITSAPGSVSQLRECTGKLLQWAKGVGLSVIVVGHVTKDGAVAGPRVLEHMVDTVLYFEGDRSDAYRLLRAVKNRFGSTNEIGVFEMQEKGLVEVTNPSEMMISGRPKNASGAVVACSLEGTRPILLEVQALVAETSFGMARRTANGVDYNRINILLAILEKRCGYAMSRFDAYVNIAGGMKMNEPALDLAVVMALVSSYKNREVDPGMLIFGEVGLSGEVRGVSQAAQRVAEAIKMGFTTVVLPKANLEKMKDEKRIRLIGVDNVRDAISLI